MKNEIQLSLSAFDTRAGLLCREEPGSNGFRALCYHCPFSETRKGGLFCSNYRIMIRARSKYGLPRWKKTRQAILDRDHYSCGICRSGDFLSVHHVDHDPTNDVHENLVTLCDRCHALVHTTTRSQRISSDSPKEWYLIAGNQEEEVTREKRSGVLLGNEGDI